MTNWSTNPSSRAPKDSRAAYGVDAATTGHRKLGEVLDYEQPGKYIVSSKNYSNEYKTPVLTAGKTFILGNTDEKENIFPTKKLPVIIFDDFTTAIKFVDFPFKVKSSAMKILHARKDIADVKYVFYAMQTTGLNHATHKRYWISEYSKIEIPLPPLSEQKKIVAKLERVLAKISEAKKLRAEAQEAAQNLLPAELHKIFSQQHSNILQNVGMSSMGKNKWEEKELGEICEINPKKSEVRNKPDNLSVSFVPMKAVDEFSQEITFFDEKKLGKIRKGYTYFRDEDVLFAKITPCMENGKVAIARNLKNGIGFGTTEFHVIRPKEGVLSEWIYAIIRHPEFRDIAKTKMTGSAGQKRVPVQFLETFKIPLPPLAEQKKIVARLDSLSEKIGKIKNLQSATQNDFVALEQSVLSKSFSG